MLSDVVAVIRSIDDIRIVQDPFRFQLLHDLLHHLVDRLQSAKSRSLELVVVLNDRIVQLRQLLYPAHTTWLVWVEVRVPRDLIVFEEMCVSFRVECCVKLHWICEFDIGVRCDRRYSQEEWLWMKSRLVQKVVCFRGDHIR